MPKTIGTSLKIVIPRDIYSAYDMLVHQDVPIKFMNARGAVPGVSSQIMLRGNWNKQGDRRKLVLDGGTTIIETMKTLHRPDYFEYELTDIKDTSWFSKTFLKQGYSQCSFQSISYDSTKVTWRFAYQPQNPLHIPILWLFMKTFYRSYMKAAARQMKQENFR